MHISRHRFEALVKDITAEVMAALSPEMRRKAEHILVVTADRPSREQCDWYNEGQADLLGLFEGVSLPERHTGDREYLPDQITLFRTPLSDMCADEADLLEEIRITVIHELGHFFGFGEDALEKLGFA
ncbi:MAG: metallopeptidase family protein [Syntrophaceae bacterium]